MNLQGPTKFKVNYTPVIPTITCERGTAKFSGEMTGRKPKLYVFSRNRMPIYVRATIRPMASRLNLGWKAQGKGGFWGYRFRHEGNEIDLDVWFDQDPVVDRKAGKRSGSDIETVEAEVVYLLRHRTGKWPSAQTEIHFYQSELEHQTEAAKILSHFGI